MKRTESPTLRDATRSLLFVIFGTITMLPWAVMSLIASLFWRGTRLYWITTYWCKIAIWGAKRIAGVRWRVLGRQNLDLALSEPGVVVLSKHQSTWETLGYPTLMPRPLSFVFKRELLFIPFFGWAMGRLDMCHIDRRQRSLAALKVAQQGRQFMDQGNWVIMFPEGTRTERGQQGDYKLGGARLAQAMACAILPVAVSSGACWARRSLILRPGTIDISFGPLIRPEGRSAEVVMREVERWIETEMRRLDPQAYEMPPEVRSLLSDPHLPSPPDEARS